MNVNELYKLHPSECQLLNEVRSAFSEWKFYYDKGYIAYIKGSVKLYEHRLVMSATDGVEVHHIDGVITNNSTDNLRIVTPQEHGCIHHPSTKTEKNCAQCGASFLVPQTQYNRSHYCSKACARLGRRKVEHPDRFELQEAIERLGNWSALGRYYGVSDNAVRKWARNYDISPKTTDGRKKNP